MKYLIVSDIHGAYDSVEFILNKFNKEKCDYILLLGDVLYHGPRNDLPERYDPKEVAGLLNPLGNRIICVRGNCDADVDQMILDFPIFSDSCVLFLDGRTIFATHGHLYDEKNPPKLSRGDVLLSGHTHLQVLRKHEEGWIYMNPGSVSIPKGGSAHGYMTVEDDRFLWKDFSGRVCMAYTGD